jgi:ubiquinol-cytochrome c reductase cytochrome c subunit
VTEASVKLREVAGVAGLVLVAATVVFAVQRQQAQAQPSEPDPDLVAAGEELYLTGCVTCHGVNGAGTDLAPTLIGVGAAAADFYLTTGRMPAAAGTDQQPNRKPPAYGDDEIEALVAYVASLGAGPAIPELDLAGADVANGGVLFRANCASCHNAAAVGGALSYGRHAPPLDDSTAVQVVEAMRIGPGQMPVFDPETIDDRSATDIAAYVQYLRDPEDPGGLSLGRVGPVTEGFVALVVGLGGAVLISIWIVGKRHA